MTCLGVGATSKGGFSFGGAQGAGKRGGDHLRLVLVSILKHLFAVLNTLKLLCYRLCNELFLSLPEIVKTGLQKATFPSAC